VPLEKWGITDSLLWSPGTPYSDVDAVVYGKDSVRVIQQKLGGLFAHKDFKRFEEGLFQKPPPMPAGDFKKICNRKLNFGYFKGTKFSLRAIREEGETSHADRTYDVIGLTDAKATVIDSSESLFSPPRYAIKSNTAEELVSYSNTYENVFVPGDEIRIKATLERVSEGERFWKRLIIGSFNAADLEYAIF